MKINLDSQIIKNLIDKIDSFSHFSKSKTGNFLSKHGARKTIERNAFDCLDAATYRIYSVVDYLNNLEISSDNKGLFEFCNFLNHSQTLIECITYYQFC